MPATAPFLIRKTSSDALGIADRVSAGAHLHVALVAVERLIEQLVQELLDSALLSLIGLHIIHGITSAPEREKTTNKWRCRTGPAKGAPRILGESDAILGALHAEGVKQARGGCKIRYADEPARSPA